MSVRDLAAAIGSFGNENVRVTTSQQFTPGTDWQAQVEQRLKETDWLLLLYKGSHRSYEQPFLEYGFFAALEKKEGARMLCLHPPQVKAPEGLRIEKVPVSDEQVERLLYGIYVKEPWQANPNYADPENADQRRDMVTKVVNAVKGDNDSEVKRFTLSMRIDVLPSSLDVWKKTGVIPDEAQVTGEGSWEQVFGKAESSGGWTWSKLVGGLQRQNSWLPVLADALRSAENGDPPDREILVPRPTPQGITYRLMVAKCATVKITGELQFHILIAPLPPRFDPTASDAFTVVHHLVAVAWHFRWGIINRHLKEINELQLLRKSSNREAQRFTPRVNQLTAEFQADMLAIEIESEIRGLTNVTGVLDAFKETEPGSEALTSKAEDDVKTLEPLLLAEWPALQRELEEAMVRGEQGLTTASELMTKARVMNRVFYERATRRYWELTRTLK
jgi:hypothetical protein